MSFMGYAVVKTATPELWLDDGYVTIDVNDNFVKVCGLTQVDSFTQTGTGVVTLNLSRLVNVVGVHPSVVGAAATDLGCTVVSVSPTGTNNGGNTSVKIVLQVFTTSTGSAATLTFGQGLCIDIRYTESNLLIGSAEQPGMCVL